MGDLQQCTVLCGQQTLFFSAEYAESTHSIDYAQRYIGHNGCIFLQQHIAVPLQAQTNAALNRITVGGQDTAMALNIQTAPLNGAVPADTLNQKGLSASHQTGNA